MSNVVSLESLRGEKWEEEVDKLFLTYVNDMIGYLENVRTLIVFQDGIRNNQTLIALYLSHIKFVCDQFITFFQSYQREVGLGE